MLKVLNVWIILLNNIDINIDQYNGDYGFGHNGEALALGYETFLRRGLV